MSFFIWARLKVSILESVFFSLIPCDCLIFTFFFFHTLESIIIQALPQYLYGLLLDHIFTSSLFIGGRSIVHVVSQ